MTIVNCKECNKEFDKKPVEIRKTNNNFCSHSCAATYHNRGRQRNPPKSYVCLCCEKQYFIVEKCQSKSYCSVECRKNNIKKYSDNRNKGTRFLDEKECPICNVVKHRDCFHQNKDGDLYTYCRSCCASDRLKKITEIKIKSIEYLGGFCKHCKYNKYIGALEFHHKNPEQKEFSLSRSNIVKFNDKLKQELDKCILLCSNCHRDEHERLATIEREIKNNIHLQDIIDDTNSKKCAHCKITKHFKHFKMRKRKTGDRPHSYCNQCCAISKYNKSKFTKEKCVRYKGTNCSSCGYNQCLSSMEFHHTNPNLKDFDICSSKLSFDDKKSELDKCILLCSNCHREEHQRLRELNNILFNIKLAFPEGLAPTTAEVETQDSIY